MSGLEIVGVTFGLLPLIISAVENYPEVTDSFNFARKYRIELKTIKQTLVAEWTIFSSMLQYVLDGLISPDVIEKLLNESSTEMWKTMSENYQFKERLGSSYTPFMDTVKDMYTSIQRCIDLLDLDDQGKVRWAEDTGIKLFAKRLRFSSQKRLFKELSETIQNHNQLLERLSRNNIRLEPSRKKWKSYKHLQRTGEFATCVFHALEASLGCNCKSTDSHTALFDIFPHSAPITTTPDTNSDFRVIVSASFSSAQATQGKTTNWQELTLEAMESTVCSVNALHVPQTIALPPRASKKGNSSTASKSRRPRFLLPVSRRSVSPPPMVTTLAYTTTITTTQDNTSSPQTALVDLRVSNLCELLCAPPSTASTSVPKHVTDGSQKFVLHQKAHSSSLECNHWSTVSLQQIIRGSVDSAPPLMVWDQLALAAAMSLAVAQLYHSPWLKGGWDQNSFLFLKREGRELYSEAFVKSQMRDPGKTAVRSTGRNNCCGTLFTLAFLLVELCLGPLEKLQIQEDLVVESHANLTTACRLVQNGSIHRKLGLGYQSAVDQCIQLAKSTKDWDDQVQRDLYDKVVSVLEDQAKRRPSGP